MVYICDNFLMGVLTAFAVETPKIKKLEKNLKKSIILSIIILLGSLFWVCTVEDEIILMIDTGTGEEDWEYYSNYDIDLQFLKIQKIIKNLFLNQIKK